MDLDKIRKEFPLKLRRAQAIALCRACGYTEYAFRHLLRTGKLRSQAITGKQSRFDRELLLTLLS